MGNSSAWPEEYRPAPMGDWTPRCCRSKKRGKKGYGTKDKIKRAKLAIGKRR